MPVLNLSFGVLYCVYSHWCFLTTWVLNNGFLIYFYGVIICFLLMLSVMIDKNLDVVHIYKVDNDKLEGYYKTYYPKIYQ